MAVHNQVYASWSMRALRMSEATPAWLGLGLGSVRVKVRARIRVWVRVRVRLGGVSGQGFGAALGLRV